MSITITRKRGDTYPIIAKLTVNGNPLDLSNSVLKFSFKKKDDLVAKTIIGQVDASDTSKAIFTPTSSDVSEAGLYYFDIQREDGSIIATHLSGKLLLEDDITK